MEYVQNCQLQELLKLQTLHLQFGRVEILLLTQWKTGSSVNIIKGWPLFSSQVDRIKVIQIVPIYESGFILVTTASKCSSGKRTAHLLTLSA